MNNPSKIDNNNYTPLLYSNKLIINRNVQPIIIVFSFFEMTMLLQTTYNRIGTIVAGTLSVIMIVLYLKKTHYVSASAQNVYILSYVIFLILTSIVGIGFDKKLFQLVIYTILFVLLGSLKITRHEADIIIECYVLTGVVYACMVILYRFKNPNIAYIHSKITVLGSQLDPNYIGLPLVVSLSLLLYYMLNNQKYGYRFVECILLSFGILLTSSRGNMLCLAVCLLFNIFVFLLNKKIQAKKKLQPLFFFFGFIFLFLLLSYKYYNSSWQRILFYKSDDITNGRYDLWMEGIHLWTKHILIGNGYEALGKSYYLGVHNTYIQVLCDSGLIGFILFSAFIYHLLKISCKKQNVLFCLIIILIHSMFLGAITSRCFWVSIILMIMLCNRRETT